MGCHLLRLAKTLPINILIKTLWWLLCAHVLTDYILQPEWMMHHKDPTTLEYHDELDSKYGPWWWSMLAHSVLNGAAVAGITGNLWLGMAEIILHFITDTMKCLGIINAWQDQNIHISSKLIWVLCYAIFNR